MVDIRKNDVRKYVEELIKKDFPSQNSEEEALSDKRQKNTGEDLNEQRRPLCNHQ